MMNPAAKIEPALWMQAPETLTVMQVLNGKGEDVSALFVGGCVRNEIMKRFAGDIDIATKFLPDVVTDKLQKAGVKIVPTGLDHGTVTAVTEGKSFEITTLRRDVSTDGRRAVVAFTEDWEEDAQRRDFTMNTLLADTKGNIYDPTGKGLDDIRERRVVFVGAAPRRIAEDYLRILRFFRFHAYYGCDEPDPEALKACREAADKIKLLSRERITQEFLKILAVDNVAAVLALMFENGVMRDIADKQYDRAVMERFAGMQAENGLVDISARLAVLSREHDRLEKYLVLSNAQKKDFLTILETLKAAGVKKLVYRYGNEAACQALMMMAALAGGNADIGQAREWKPPAFPLDGEDILKAGIDAGPRVGEILAAIENWWIENDFIPDRAACLERLKELTE